VIIINSAMVKLGGVNIGSPRKGCNSTLVRYGPQGPKPNVAGGLLFLRA